MLEYITKKQKPSYFSVILMTLRQKRGRKNNWNQTKLNYQNIYIPLHELVQHSDKYSPLNQDHFNNSVYTLSQVNNNSNRLLNSTTIGFKTVSFFNDTMYLRNQNVSAKPKQSLKSYSKFEHNN